MDLHPLEFPDIARRKGDAPATGYDRDLRVGPYGSIPTAKPRSNRRLMAVSSI